MNLVAVGFWGWHVVWGLGGFIAWNLVCCGELVLGWFALVVSRVVLGLGVVLVWGL